MLPEFVDFAISMRAGSQVISMFLSKFTGTQVFGSVLDQGHSTLLWHPIMQVEASDVSSDITSQLSCSFI